MKNLNATMEQLKAIPTPEPTKSWFPVGHYDLVNIVNQQIDKIGMGIVNSRYELNQTGTNLFASMTLDVNGGDSRFMLGFRNSLNKELSIGFTAGINILVCSNMMFSGEYLSFRKHTSGLSLLEVEEFAHGAIIELPKQKKIFDSKLISYREVELGNRDHKALVYDLMDKNILRPSSFGSYTNTLKEEQAKGHNVITLNTVHNAITRLYRKKSLEMISLVTPALTTACDEYYAKVAA